MRKPDFAQLMLKYDAGKGVWKCISPAVQHADSWSFSWLLRCCPSAFRPRDTGTAVHTKTSTAACAISRTRSRSISRTAMRCRCLTLLPARRKPLRRSHIRRRRPSTSPPAVLHRRSFCAVRRHSKTESIVIALNPLASLHSYACQPASAQPLSSRPDPTQLHIRPFDGLLHGMERKMSKNFALRALLFLSVSFSGPCRTAFCAIGKFGNDYGSGEGPFRQRRFERHRFDPQSGERLRAVDRHRHHGEISAFQISR